MHKPRKLLENFENSWWTHSDYEVRARFIAPRTGAVLRRYDPWRANREGDHETIRAALDDILDLFSTEEETGLSVNGVLEWSNKYGPLGVLLHQTVAVTFPPRALDVVTDRFFIEEHTRRQQSPSTDEEIGSGAGIIVAFRFQGAWHKQAVLLPVGLDLSNVPPTAALLRNIHAIEQPFVEKPIGEAWGPFFPDVLPSSRDTHPYPEPESSAFANAYCEPLEEWIRWAGLLTSAIAELRVGNVASQWAHGSATLSWLAQPIAPRMSLDKRSEVHFAWRSPSLLSSLALIAMQRLAAKRSVLCKDPACGRVFIPSNPRAEYHKDSCRWRHIKELSRAAARPKRKTARKRRKGSS